MRNSKNKHPGPTAVGLCAAAMGAIVWAESARNAPLPRTPVSRSTSSADTESPSLEQKAQGARKPLSHYVSLGSGGLFSAPVPPPKPQPSPARKSTAPPPPPKPAPPTVDPMAGYVYTGTVTLEGQIVALVENTKTKEGQYLRTGDSFLGGTVQQAGEQELTIRWRDIDCTLRKNENFRLTPLDKNAPYLGENPPPTAPLVLQTAVREYDLAVGGAYVTFSTGTVRYIGRAGRFRAILLHDVEREKALNKWFEEKE